MSETIVEESIPPDKKAPRGTSDIICLLTDEAIKLSNFFTASSGVPLNLLTVLFFITSLTSQYFLRLEVLSSMETSKTVQALMKIYLHKLNAGMGHMHD